MNKGRHKNNVRFTLQGCEWLSYDCSLKTDILVQLGPEAHDLIFITCQMETGILGQYFLKAHVDSNDY